MNGDRPPAPSSPQEETPETFLNRAFTEFADAGTTLPRFVARRPRQAVRVLRAIRALPTLTAAFPDGPEAAELQRQLLRWPASRRLTLGVSAVLDTPLVPGTYLDGHGRATVRRKVRAAEKQGVVVRAVEAADRPALLALANRHDMEHEREEYRTETPENDDLLKYDLWLAAYDAEGAPIVLAVIPTAGEWSVLRYFRILVAGRTSSDARYLMAAALAEELGRRGVRHLVDSSRPHWLPNGLRHFQGMLGFRLVRVPAVRRG